MPCCTHFRCTTEWPTLPCITPMLVMTSAPLNPLPSFLLLPPQPLLVTITWCFMANTLFLCLPLFFPLPICFLNCTGVISHSSCLSDFLLSALYPLDPSLWLQMARFHSFNGRDTFWCRCICRNFFSHPTGGGHLGCCHTGLLGIMLLGVFFKCFLFSSPGWKQEGMWVPGWAPEGTISQYWGDALMTGTSWNLSLWFGDSWSQSSPLPQLQFLPGFHPWSLLWEAATPCICLSASLVLPCALPSLMNPRKAVDFHAVQCFTWC